MSQVLVDFQTRDYRVYTWSYIKSIVGTVAKAVVVQEITKKMLQRQFLRYRMTESLDNKLPRGET